MTDKKLTDSEIFEKLERYKDVSDSDITTTSVDTILLKATYLFINRLQAENERLKDFATSKCADCAGCTSWKCDCANIEAEAYKKFAERLLKKELESEYFSHIAFQALNFDTNNLLKELVGDSDEVHNTASPENEKE